MYRTVIIFILFPVILWSEEKSNQNEWNTLKYFVGAWVGHETGKAGSGKGEREHKFIMNDNKFTEIFELAPPEKDFKVYLKNHWKRKE